MSAGACPVCGSLTHFKLPSGDPVFNCGGGAVYGCGNARAAEIERLNAEKAELLALCKRLSALPGDYNSIQDAEFVFRDINTTVSKFANTFCRDDRKTQPETK